MNGTEPAVSEHSTPSERWNDPDEDREERRASRGGSNLARSRIGGVGGKGAATGPKTFTPRVIVNEGPDNDSPVVGGGTGFTFGKSQTETTLFDQEDGTATAVEGEETRNLSWAQRNMNSVVESNKEGPWWTQKEHLMDDEERRPDHPDYDPSTVHIPKAE